MSNNKRVYFDWDEEKNKKLKEENRLLDTFNHPNQKRYPGQKIMVVEINDYAYMVPYVNQEEKFFLKTIIPSSKATKKYLRGK